MANSLMLKKGENVKKNIIPVLSDVIQILQNLKTIYEEFPQGEAGAETEKVVARIGQTITKYEQELAYYQKLGMQKQSFCCQSFTLTLCYQR